MRPLRSRSTSRSRGVIRWLARITGTALLVLHVREGVFQVAKLSAELWAVADRIYSAGFLAMLAGLVLGWISDRAAAGLLVAGYALATCAPLLGTTSRPMRPTSAAELAVEFLPLLLVGLAYVYSGTRRRHYA